MTEARESRPPYTARSIKATALLDESKALLRAWTPGESSASLLRRAREESLLGKATASRSDDVVANAFVKRFLSGTQPAAPRLKSLLEAKGVGRWFTDLSLLYAARADIVLREAITLYAAERRASGRCYLDTPSFVGFIEEQQTAGRMQRPWSSSVKEGVAQHVLRQMTDFGLAGPSRRGIRELLPFEPTGLAVAWLAYDLHFHDLPDSRVLMHPDWGLWTLDQARVRERLAWLARPGLWEIQAAGAVVQITWACSTMEEVLDVLARNELS
ncbi:BrxA family protein [uncultured Thiocystis sp.]|jgi:hypothetical protein|uniref:BrxA family protein n=1 Tax=uncultured Thiocystis sp. TaxID=1202134 RepID=UPI0025DA98CF|nr:BrxA family protein [uncultured Thiocystis sp.]